MTLTWGETPPPEPTLRRLRLVDAPRALAVSQRVGWHTTLADWERALLWGGRGCFGLFQGETLLATALTIGYGRDRAWIGMVMTDPDHRRHGYGQQVTLAALDYLRGQGVEHILLDATEVGRPLYERLGFRPLYDIEVWHGRASSYLGSRARPLRPDDLPAVIALDADVFGVARGRIIRRLVMEFPRLAWVDEERGQITGFALAKLRGDERAYIGPWVHRNPWGAEKLLRTALSVLIGREVRVDIPDRNTQATAFTHAYDLRYRRHTTRMIFGNIDPPPSIIHQMYGVASLKTG